MLIGAFRFYRATACEGKHVRYIVIAILSTCLQYCHIVS